MNARDTGLLLLLFAGIGYLIYRNQSNTTPITTLPYTPSGTYPNLTGNSPMTGTAANSLDAAGLAFIKQQESCSLVKYWDVDGYSIGYGHHFQPGETVLDAITQGQADIYLTQDTVNAQSIVNSYVAVPLTQNQFNALVDFVYNLGENNFSNSTLLSDLNSGDYASAADEFSKWIYAGGSVNQGLIDRRAAERALFLSA